MWCGWPPVIGINATCYRLYRLNPVVQRLWKNPYSPTKPAVENPGLRHHQWPVNAVMATNRLWKNLWKTVRKRAPTDNFT
jgi:hypothetical protein